MPDMPIPAGFSVALTEQEAKNLLLLLDVAVKAGGLANAQVALPLAGKIDEAMQNAFGPNPETEGAK